MKKKIFALGFVCGVVALAFGARPLSVQTNKLAEWTTKMADQAVLNQREKSLREFQE